MRMQEPKRTLIEWIVLAMFVVIPLSMVASVAVGLIGMPGMKYSEGSRSGVVQKFSKKGIVWQTWEGELNLGYMTNRPTESGSQLAPAIFNFSCYSEEAAKEVVEAAKSGQRVTLQYVEYIGRGYRYGSTGYDVTGVAK